MTNTNPSSYLLGDGKTEKLTSINLLVHIGRLGALDCLLGALQREGSTSVARASSVERLLQGVSLPAEDVVAVLGVAISISQSVS